MFNLFFAVLAILGATIHVGLSKQRRSNPVQAAATYLLYLLVIYVGVMGVFTAYAHVFRPAETSASIGWLQSPYEYEVGMADLTLGVLGILCIWIRGTFWLATALGNAVWLLGDAAGHLMQMRMHNNHAKNNSGVFLVAEIVTPVLILILMMFVQNAMNRADAGTPQLRTPKLRTVSTLVVLVFALSPVAAFSQGGERLAPDDPARFSSGFLRAGIEAMTVIREWRIAIANPIQNNYPLDEQKILALKRSAESKTALASAAATKDADRSGLLLLANELKMMQEMSGKYLDLHRNLTYIGSDAVAEDSVNQQILACATGLSAIAASGIFQDVAECH